MGTGPKSVSLAQAKAHLSDLLDEAQRSPRAIEIRESGQPVAYLVGAEAYKRLKGIEDSVRAVQLRRELTGSKHDLHAILAAADLSE